MHMPVREGQECLIYLNISHRNKMCFYVFLVPLKIVGRSNGDPCTSSLDQVGFVCVSRKC